MEVCFGYCFSRTARASLGASAVRYTFTVTDFHRLPFAGLPAHPSTASKTEVVAQLRDFCFAPSNGHRQPGQACPNGADDIALAASCGAIITPE
jgi:hypothetical protein